MKIEQKRPWAVRRACGSEQAEVGPGIGSVDTLGQDWCLITAAAYLLQSGIITLDGCTYRQHLLVLQTRLHRCQKTAFLYLHLPLQLGIGTNLRMHLQSCQQQEENV